MIPAGTYYAVGFKGEMRETNTGKPCMNVACRITHQEVDGDWHPIDPIERTVRIYLSSAAMETSEKKLETLGFNGRYGDPGFAAEGTSLTCEHEEYNGKDVERWEIANWGGAAKPVDAEAIRALDNAWRAKHETPEKPAGAPSAPPPPPAANGTPPASDAPDGAEIPF